ncbi:branched-chain amino acid transport system II carrier protein [Candidatus Babeliales bacterium]|nr:branched-chain amino acid transport system II carrier protein [Candidatus Babeliales bacterium]
MTRKQIISLGVALFAIFFGAGNVVFPLDLGRMMGDHVTPAIVGIFFSAVVMPLLGLFSGVLFGGDYRAFFQRLGKKSGELWAFLCMILIGPFGAIPRTITLSHSAFAWYFPSFSLAMFSFLSAIIVWFLTVRKNEVMDVIGRYLGPLKIVLLLSVIVSAFFIKVTPPHTDISNLNALVSGFFEGFLTLDLLGAIFFSKLVFDALDKDLLSSPQRLLHSLFKAGVIGSLLLGGVYVGFMVAGAIHAAAVTTVPREQLIFALSDHLLGRLGMLSSFTVAAACLTTAVALTSLFADYLSIYIFRRKISYRVAVTLTVTITAAFANLGFSGIMDVIVPIVTVCYPAMIVLSILNILYKTNGFRFVKVPVYATVVITFFVQYWDRISALLCG